MTVAARIDVPRVSTYPTRSPATTTRDERIELDLAAAGLEVRARRLAEHLVERPGRHAERRVERVVAEDLPENPHEWLGLGLRRRLVEGGDGQRLPQQRRSAAASVRFGSARPPPSRQAAPEPARRA